MHQLDDVAFVSVLYVPAEQFTNAALATGQ
jgi:hypothetical protein